MMEKIKLSLKEIKPAKLKKKKKKKRINWGKENWRNKLRISRDFLLKSSVKITPISLSPSARRVPSNSL
jgi:hypothetical protein